MKLCKLLLLIPFLFFCNACDILEKDTSEQPQSTITAIGFEGILPNGITFNKENIETSNGLEAFSSSNEGSFITHVLTLSEPSCVSISIELPSVKFSNDFMKINDSLMNVAAEKYYKFSKVKEALTPGDKEIISQQTTGVWEAFRIGVFNQKTYEGYVAEQGLDQSGSYIRVVSTEEGIATDAKLGNVQTLEVVFDVNIKLYSYYPNTKYAGRMKGLLKVRYKEKI
jgi:hypothetical protein